MGSVWLICIQLALVTRTLAEFACPAASPCTCAESFRYGTFGPKDKVVNCRNKRLNVIPDLHEVQGHNIKAINLAGNNISFIPKHAFINIQVGTLQLSFNPIEGAHAEAFFNVTGLKTIMLDNCKLKKLPTDSFQYLPQTRRVDLMHNGLTKLEKGVFVGLDSLYEVDLSGNKLQVIDEDAFQGVENTLNTININKCGLTSFPVAFQKVTTLTSIWADDNEFTHLDKNIMAGLNKNRKMTYSLNNNKISKIEPDTFTECNFPIYLYLNNNNVTNLDFVDPCMFAKSTISLFRNPLHCDCDMYRKIRYRTYVTLSGRCANPSEFYDMSIHPFTPDMDEEEIGELWFANRTRSVCHDDDPLSAYDCTCQKWIVFENFTREAGKCEMSPSGADSFTHTGLIVFSVFLLSLFFHR